MKYLLLATAFLSAGLPFSQTHASEADTVCPVVLRDLSRVRRLPVLMECMDYYFLNPDLDPDPASFNAPIRIGYRILEIDAHHVDTYSNVAWMLWSKWSNWREAPERMPDGELKLEEAIQLLDRGASINARLADYFIAAGNTLWPVARNFDSSVYPRVIEWFKTADRLLPYKDKRQVRTRLNLGHIYKLTGRNDEARRYYLSVLEIDPDNRIARRALELLDP